MILVPFIKLYIMKIDSFEILKCIETNYSFVFPYFRISAYLCMSVQPTTQKMLPNLILKLLAVLVEQSCRSGPILLQNQTICENLILKVSLILGKIKYLTMTDASKVWMPDTFFRNEKIGRFHTILTPNLYVRVFPNGDVLYSIR